MPLTTTPSRTIAVVLDPAFASRLPSLAERAAVWIVDSAENRPAMESLWTARRTRGAEYDVTVFRAIPDLSPEAHIDSVVRSVKKQHDRDMPDVEIGAIEVYGTAVSDAMRSTFEAHGYARLELLADGFRAHRRRTG